MQDHVEPRDDEEYQVVERADGKFVVYPARGFHAPPVPITGVVHSSLAAAREEALRIMGRGARRSHSVFAGD